jgi:predicted transcriptional regulator
MEPTPKTEQPKKKQNKAPKKAPKTTKMVEQIVRYEMWTNLETGESRQFAVVDRPHGTDFGFHKVWLEDFARIIGLLGGGKIKVFNYLLSNINPYSNEFGGTIREIATKLDVDNRTVQVTIQTLVLEGFMKKVRTGTYLVSARFLVKGGHDKRMGLMLKYDELNDGRQLNAFAPTESVTWESPSTE